MKITQADLNAKWRGQYDRRLNKKREKELAKIKKRMLGDDAAPVRHGYWVIADADKGEYICSVCGETDTDCSDRYSNHNVFSQEYCPNCGAKMDADD